MEQDKIYEIIRLWQDEILGSQGLERYCEKQILESMNSKPIKIISGFRRVGKSYLCKRIAKKLLDDGYKIENILYLNFEDYKLNWVTDAYKLGEVYDVFQKFFAKENQNTLLIFDEIQKVKDWEAFVRTLYEKNKPNQIIITGSNSDMLSSELSSSLAGRFIEFTILPFSFKEYLIYHKHNYSRYTSLIANQFYEYLKLGGLPEIYTINDPDTRASYIDSLISKVILDDVIKRFSIRNESAIEMIIKFVFANNGRTLSFSKITKYLKTLGMKIQEETVIEYVNHIKKTFAIIEVCKFDWTSKKIFASSKKYYAIDIGISSQFQNLISNLSFNLENIVVLKLKQNPKIKNIFYGSTADAEIDFITEDYQGKLKRYQISQELNDDNRERELNAFIKSDKYLAKTPAYIITLEGISRSLEGKYKSIEQINLIDWLLFN